MEQTTISAIIIDDEPAAVALLEVYLRQFPFVVVAGKECNAVKGLELAKEIMPELVFLDIDMPGMNGLSLAEKLQTDNCYSSIVFTTAHQNYAYDALGIEPVDFLVKPFGPDDVGDVIGKYLSFAEKKKQQIKLGYLIAAAGGLPKIEIPTVTGVLFIETRNIVMLKSKFNKCDIYLDDGTVETSSLSLGKVVRLIGSPMLFQISRSTFVNLNFLQRVDKKNSICTIYFNQTVVAESISRGNLALFEKVAGNAC